MSVRIPWDKQETVLLIDAYLKIKNKQMSQREAVKEVSTLLRRRASLLGLTLDQTFRNENGISIQLHIIGGLIDETPSGLHSASKMFAEMVDLYKNNRSEFDKILIQAKGECTMQISAQDMFFAWLSQRISLTLLSELRIAGRDIESFCVNKQILATPLFETTDLETIQNVVNTVRANKMFRFKHFCSLGKMKKVMDYYQTFLHECATKKKEAKSILLEESSDSRGVCLEKTAIHTDSENDARYDAASEDDIKRSEEIGDNQKALSKEALSVENEVCPILSEEDTYSTSTETSNTMIWNFASERIDFMSVNPIQVSYFGETKECNGWRNVFVQIIGLLEEDYPIIVQGMAGQCFGEVDRIIISGSDEIDKLRQPEAIGDGLYVETDCTPDDIVTITRLLMDKCNMDYDNLEIEYEFNQKVLYSITSGDLSRLTTSDDWKEKYSAADSTDLTNNGTSNGGIHDYIVQILNEMSIPYVDNRNDNGCLWVLGDENLGSILEKFTQYSAAFHYKPEGGRTTKGESAWWTKDIIMISGESPRDSHETQLKSVEEEHGTKVASTSVFEEKTAFERWLVSGAGFSENSAHSYSSAIKAAGEYAVRLGFSEKELYCVVDAERAYQIGIQLLANPEFARLNDSQHNRYRAALSKYCAYCSALSRGTTTDFSVRLGPDQKDEIKKNAIAFIEWARGQKMLKAVIMAFLSDIKKCNVFAKKRNYINEGHVFLVKDADILERVVLKMRKDPKFIALDSEQQYRLVSAMNELIAFRKTLVNSTAGTENAILTMKRADGDTVQDPTTSAIDPQVKQRYAAVLAENFVDGFRPTKTIDRNRFRMYYCNMYGQELNEGDDDLVHTLMMVGTFRDDRIFVKDEAEQKDLLEEVNETIMETFEAGASCIYLECLYTRYQARLAEILHIYNVDSLESVLFSSGKRNYFKRYNYLFRNNKEPAPRRDVVDYMKNAPHPVTYSELGNSLWFIPLEKIKNVLVNAEGIVNVASETYFYAPNLPVNEDELRQIAEIIDHSLMQRNFISDVELMRLLEEHCPSVLMNTSNYTTWGLRNALAYLLCEKFSFRGAIISKKNEEISMAAVFKDLCQRSIQITVDELKSFASGMNAGVYWKSVYSEMIRVNQNEFVRRDQIHFDVKRIDSVLESLIPDVYMPVKSINLFLLFPTIDVPWNNFVLESYVANSSKEFKLLHVGYSATDCCGAIVRKESDISDYRTLVVDVLAQNTGWKTAKEALQLLVDLGYQQRRGYSDIEKVMQEALARRDQQGN